MPELSLGDAAKLFTQLALEMPMAERAALDHASKLILDEIKAEIGHYQDRAGQFAAWPELAESTKADRVKQGFSENEPLLRTGELRDSYERTVHTNEAWVGSNDDKAVYHELGTKHIPPRSVIGIAAMHKEREIVAATGRILYGHLTTTNPLTGAQRSVAKIMSNT